MSRRDNPDTRVVVGYGLGAIVLGLIGWFGYKAYSGSASAPAAGGDPLASLPEFDPASTDTEHPYLVSVFGKPAYDEATAMKAMTDVASSALAAMRDNGEIDLAKLLPVRSFLETLPPIDHLVVEPFDVDTTFMRLVHDDPVPDLALEVSRSGRVGEAWTRTLLLQARAM